MESSFDAGREAADLEPELKMVWWLVLEFRASGGNDVHPEFFGGGRGGHWF